MFMKKTLLGAMLGFVLLMNLGSLASAMTLDGATIRATAAFPDLTFPTVTAGPVDAIVGAGVEFTDGMFTPFFGPSFDFAGNTLTITQALTGHSAGTFNGYIFNDILNGLSDFSAFSILSDTTGFFSGDPTRISFDANNLYVNFASLDFANQPEARIVLGITTLDAPTVPLPAALPLFAAGLGAMGLLSRRKKRKFAVAAQL
jgi:hypothetical protein